MPKLCATTPLAEIPSIRRLARECARTHDHNHEIALIIRLGDLVGGISNFEDARELMAELMDALPTKGVKV